MMAAPEQLLIRRFEAGDEHAVSHVIQTTMMQSNSEDYPLSILQPLRDYFTPEKVAILASERYCLVALYKGAIVGTGALEAGELKTLFVLPEYQGKGVGKRLVEQAEAFALKAGIQAIKVPASTTGLPFYIRLGYEQGETFISKHAGQQTWLTKTL